MYARNVGGWFAAHRLRRRGVSPVPAAWQERLRRLAEGAGVSKIVSLWESSMTDVPVVIGVLRPVILLPLGLVAGLPSRQLEFVLLHELAHIRRNDYLVNLLQKLVEGLLFYHPAVWWVSGLVCAERENCCDDVVLALGGDAPGYAAALAALEEGRPGAPVPAATGGSLVQRIRRMLEPREAARVAVAPVFAAGLLLSLAAVALAEWADHPPAQGHPSPSPAPVVQQSTTPRAVMQQSRAGKPYLRWLNEDVAYIITAEERSAFESLSADAERDHFIEQFWQRRDPTPGTVRNEFKEEHYRRIAYSNERFSANGVPGWKTDRGHIYISYGPPDEIDDHSSGVPSNPWMVWRYRYIEGVGANVTVEFTDPERSGEFRMTKLPQPQ